MTDKRLDRWSKEEPLAELRHRQRGVTRTRGARGAARGLLDELREVPTSRLAAVKGQQRVISGTDGRLDLLAVKSKKVRDAGDAVAAGKIPKRTPR